MEKDQILFKSTSNLGRYRRMLQYFKSQGQDRQYQILKESVKSDTKIQAFFKKGFGEVCNIPAEVGVLTCCGSTFVSGLETIYMEDFLLPLLQDKTILNNCFECPVKMDFPILQSRNCEILDGHKRWLAAMSVNPDCIIPCIEFDFEGPSAPIIRMIRKGSAVPDKTANHIREANISDIRKYVDSNLADDVLAELQVHLPHLNTRRKAVRHITECVIGIHANNIMAGLKIKG